MAPSEMTVDRTATPTMKSLDGKLLKAVIKFETTFAGCALPRVCYEITHSNIRAVAAGEVIKFSISGTTNQDSVRDAGKFSVSTQLEELTGALVGTYYDIDTGEFPSNFLTKEGGISLTSGKAMKSTNYETYSGNAAYTVYFTTYDYVPADGTIVIKLPPAVKILTRGSAGFTASSNLL